jgi:hypothetical protein
MGRGSTRRLVSLGDVPKLDRALSRAPAPDVEVRLMAGVVRALQADAEDRGWTGEEQRHRGVAQALENHLDGIRPGLPMRRTCLTGPLRAG